MIAAEPTEAPNENEGWRLRSTTGSESENVPIKSGRQKAGKRVGTRNTYSARNSSAAALKRPTRLRSDMIEHDAWQE